MLKPILAEAWRIYKEQFGLIAALVIVVWLPCELFSSYMDAFVFGPEDFRKSFKLAQFLENFIGIIATAAVTFAAVSLRSGQSVGFGHAISVGFRSWGRMWWTRFLTGVVLILGLILLVVPGIYLFVRLSFVEVVAVVEQTSGSEAMQRSFELTKGRFWEVFRLGIAVVAIVLIPVVLVILPGVFIPDLDHWLIDAASQLVCDVLAAFATVVMVCGYKVFVGQLEPVHMDLQPGA